MLLKQKLPGVRQNVSLRNHTTFKIGGPAKYFFIARISEDIVRAVAAAKELNIPLFILSGGSNVLFSDDGFSGFVVKTQTTNYKIEGAKIQTDVGVEMATLVREAGQRGLSGLEWAGGLPGSVGGAVRGNAGAFGGEIKDSIIEVEALDAKGKRTTFSNTECQFGYRTSIFKKNNLIVLTATLSVQKGDKQKIQDVAKEHMNYRKERHPLEYPNAGSIFKNCDVKKMPKKVQEEFKDVIKTDPFPVIPTAALLAAAKLQGTRVGDVQISEKHPNYIVNRGNGSAKDVMALIAKVKKHIQNKFGVELEEEITFLS
jgi:UDP-N-acetylmuramate dehydrogenase